MASDIWNKFIARQKKSGIKKEYGKTVAQKQLDEITSKKTDRFKKRAKKKMGTCGYLHYSGWERKRCEELRLLERAGEISNLEHFPKLFLGPERWEYTPDFRYKSRESNFAEFEYEEVKGAEGETWKRNKRSWPFNGPGILRVTAWNDKAQRSILKKVITLKEKK